jgi:hypothetical protein
VVIATPFDEKLTVLARELDGTRAYYGTKEEQLAGAAQLAKAKDITEKASTVANADRAIFNSTGAAGPSGSLGAFGTGGSRDLLNDLVNGAVTLDKLDEKLLPENMLKMTPKEREAYIKELQEKRKELTAQIADLSAQRAEFQKQELARMGDKGKDSFEAAIMEAVTTQRAAFEKSVPEAKVEDKAPEAKTGEE